jgi:hypothetical protein
MGSGGSPRQPVSYLQDGDIPPAPEGPASRLPPTLRRSNAGNDETAPGLLDELAAEAGFVLGDLHYNSQRARRLRRAERTLVMIGRDLSPGHGDSSVDERRVFHQLRSLAMENSSRAVTRSGCRRRGPHAGAHQLALLHRSVSGDDLGVGLKPLVSAA